MKKYSKAGTVVFLLILVFGLNLILGGCSILKDKSDNDNWEDDVLWARECGQDGLRCCARQEPSCLYGQKCCLDPRDESKNRCSDDCSCGKAGNYCCAKDPGCEDGLACYMNFCVSCGGDSEPCCAGKETCSGDLVCHRGLCVECGKPGNPCCVAELKCQNQDGPDGQRIECIDNLCIYCGSEGKISCASDPACNSGHLLNNNYCLMCGQPNQPCCNKDSGVDYKCAPVMDMECLLGFCTAK